MSFFPTLANRTRDIPDFPRLFNDLDKVFGTSNTVPNLEFNMDIVEKPDSYEVKAELPGISEDDVEITLEDRLLTITAQKHTESLEEGSRWVRREVKKGSVARSISLPKTTDLDGIEAHLDAGILSLTIPKAEDQKVKRIALS
jgi:HSP20 family protein